MLNITAKIVGRIVRLFDSFVGKLTLAQSGFVAQRPVQISRQVRLRATDGGQGRLGANVALGRFSDVTVKYGCMEIGINTVVGQGSVICARERITIGSDCLIGEYATIRDQDHKFGYDKITSRNGFVTAPILIGNNVWIGAKATVTRGVIIGENTVIAANAVVTQDIPANSVAAGVPACVIRTLDV